MSDTSRALTLRIPGLATGVPRVGERLNERVLELFDECGPGLLRYVRSFGLPSAASEDVVQEVFLSLFRHLRAGRSEHNLRAWLFAVAHNLALKQRRQQLRLKESELDAATLAGLIDRRATPEQTIAETERTARLRAVFRALPDRDRRCLYLRADGLGYRAIAKILGVSLGSVAKSVTRAMERMQRSGS